MILSEFGWYTEDRIKIFAQVWTPDTPIKAVFCLVHGLGEYSGRYKELPAILTNAGYVLMTYDQRGHGKSEGKRGHTPSYQAYLSDISKLLSEAELRFPGKKIFLYGHSMGGNLVLNYSLKYTRANLAGVIATSPWLKLTRPLSPFMNWVAIKLSKYLPEVRTFHGIKSSDPSRKKIEEEKKIIDEYLHPWISARTYVSLWESGKWALEHASEFKYPLLIFHGDVDRVTSVEGSSLFISKVKTDCDLKIISNLSHDIHNEPARNEIFNAMIDWLNLHIQ